VRDEKCINIVLPKPPLYRADARNVDVRTFNSNLIICSSINDASIGLHIVHTLRSTTYAYARDDIQLYRIITRKLPTIRTQLYIESPGIADNDTTVAFPICNKLRWRILFDIVASLAFLHRRGWHANGRITENRSYLTNRLFPLSLFCFNHHPPDVATNLLSTICSTSCFLSRLSYSPRSSRASSSPPLQGPALFKTSSHLYPLLHRLFVWRAYRDAGTIAITAMEMKLKPRTDRALISNLKTWRICRKRKNSPGIFRHIPNQLPKGWVHQIQDISRMLRITAWYMIHAVHASAVSGPGGKSGWRGSARLRFRPTLTKQFSNKGWRAVQRRHEGATTKGNSRKIAGRPMGAVVARSNQLVLVRWPMSNAQATQKPLKFHEEFVPFLKSPFTLRERRAIVRGSGLPSRYDR